MAVSFKGAHVPQEILRRGVRWYVAYPLSDRHVDALMEERGGSVDQATSQRWGVQYSSPVADACHRRPRPGRVRGRLDATSSKVKGEWRAL
jgi:putative transposase